MASWKGPLGATHDFFSHGVAIEVKASTVKQKRFVKISSEYQLDIEGAEKLFLAHLELNENTNSAESFNLVTLVSSIKEYLTADFYPLFDGLLACVGYRDVDAHFYDKKQYSLVDKTCYSVTAEFPRLTNENLSPNISDIQYRLNLAGLDAYKIEVEDVINAFLGN
jgi:hypothetical protein